MILISSIRLKPIDIVVLKKLSEVVNVVPVIAKSDCLTMEERDAFRQRVCICSHMWDDPVTDGDMID